MKLPGQFGDRFEYISAVLSARLNEQTVILLTTRQSNFIGPIDLEPTIGVQEAQLYTRRGTAPHVVSL